MLNQVHWPPWYELKEQWNPTPAVPKRVSAHVARCVLSLPTCHPWFDVFGALAELIPTPNRWPAGVKFL